MVATSRKSHACSTPDSHPEVSATAPAPEGEPQLTTLREVYDYLVGRTELRAEVINGRLIVSPLASPEHQDIQAALIEELRPHARKNGWKTFGGLDICAEGTREPYSPDLAVCPPDAPRWGEREIYAGGMIMVGEIVSRSSATDDHTHKPGIYATARIPLFLLVDPIAAPQSVTVYSEPKEGQYTVSATVAIGKEIQIPAPVDFLLDTAVFL